MHVGSHDGSPRHAAQMLGEITELRRRVRRSLGTPWFPLVCFGLLTMLSAPLVAIMGTAVLVPFWLIAATSGMLLTRRYYRGRARLRGVGGRGRRAGVLAASMCAAAFTAGILAGATGGQAAGVLAPVTVILVGYAGLGWLLRSPAPALAVAPAAALAGALVLAKAAPWTVELTFGAALVAAGASLRARDVA